MSGAFIGYDIIAFSCVMPAFKMITAHDARTAICVIVEMRDHLSDVLSCCTIGPAGGSMGRDMSAANIKTNKPS